MRVLWITNDLPPRPGGIEQFIGNLLARGPVDTTMVLGPASEEGPSHDATLPYDVRRLTGRVLPTRSTRRAVQAAAREHQPDVVVLGAMWPLGELASWLSRDVAPVVALSHGHEAGLVSTKQGWLVRRATKGLSALTTISDYTERLLAPHSRARQIVRIPPGVDVAAFRPGLATGDLRRSWGVPSDAPVIGCISRFVDRKGQDTLLRTWPRVRALHPDAWLVLLGVGPLEDALHRAVAELGPQGQVRLPGKVSWDDLPRAHAAFDVFAMPCRTRLGGLDVEGLGIVYLEAQAVGVPVVAGQSGGAPETVVEGDTGLVVDGRDDDEVVRALDALLGDPDRRRAMGAAGREHAVDAWSWDVIADRFNRLLQDVSRSGS